VFEPRFAALPRADHIEHSVMRSFLRWSSPPAPSSGEWLTCWN